jgi:hypothetical protein
VNQTRIGIRFWIAALLVMFANSMAQAEPKQQGWGEEFNTAGANLEFHETERSHISGRTVVTYNLLVSGLPHDTQYVLWTRLVGRDPQPAADALLNHEGKVVSQLADRQRNLAEDPINLKVFAGKGEPKGFGLISKDGRFRVFAQAIPFPIDVSSGPCHLSAVMTQENYLGLFIRITGFQPGEDMVIETQSQAERLQSKAKASEQGTYNSALFPSVKGKRSGKVWFNVTAHTCKVGIELPWGEGSYELQ